MINCKKCGQQLPDDYLAKKANQKSERLKESKRLSKSNGAPIRHDRKKILELRLSGLKLRQVAEQIGCSIATVKVAMRDEVLK